MNYYKILGLQENATLDEIKNAYRVLAKKYHPDLNDDRNAEFLFLQIKEAYEILRNPITRAEYDHNLNKNNFYHSNSNSNNDTTGKTSDMKSTQNSLGTFLLVLVFTLVAIVFIPLVSNPNSAVDAIQIAKDNAPYNPETFARLGTVKKIYGWNSIHISRNTYFVSYEFDENDTDKQNGYSFYCFEVNISTKKVTEIIGNQILEEKYKKLGYID